jgi:hypothetical protein
MALSACQSQRHTSQLSGKQPTCSDEFCAGGVEAPLVVAASSRIVLALAPPRGVRCARRCVWRPLHHGGTGAGRLVAENSKQFKTIRKQFKTIQNNSKTIQNN